ncbi:MAG: DUF2891 family protein [Alphaproteobacteria bacterium]|nr:DUF2891 family protein [Alphaproteobacteria bacterium]
MRDVLLACLLVSFAGATSAPAVTKDLSAELARFLDDRASFATALTKPIAVCVGRSDTDHPAFDGCIDWHSSVHGLWALTAYEGATGDRRFDALIHHNLTPEKLARELSDLRSRPKFEMPYGRAWLLRLAIDYERVFGDHRLAPLAQEAAHSIMAYYTQEEPDPLSTAYASATWALINLYDFGIASGDAKIMAFVRDKVRANYLRPGACPLQAVEVATREFLAVCTNWAWLVSKVLPRDDFKAWVNGFLPDSLPIKPIISAESVHQAGLNFSRAWGLWHLYRATGEGRFLRAYLDHFKSTYERPKIWDGDYGTLSHWVAQFGMLALMVSYDDPAPTGAR